MFLCMCMEAAGQVLQRLNKAFSAVERVFFFERRAEGPWNKSRLEQWRPLLLSRPSCVAQNLPEMLTSWYQLHKLRKNIFPSFPVKLPRITAGKLDFKFFLFFLFFFFLTRFSATLEAVPWFSTFPVNKPDFHKQLTKSIMGCSFQEETLSALQLSPAIWAKEGNNLTSTVSSV